MSDEAARSYVLALLARRDYPRSVLEQKLKKRGLSKSETAALLDQLRQAGIFREEAYQAARTRQLLKRGEGPALVKARLRSQKIQVKDDDIRAAFEQMSSEPAELLRQQIQKTLTRLQGRGTLKPRELEYKVLQALLRKGHSASEIRRELSALLKAQS